MLKREIYLYLQRRQRREGKQKKQREEGRDAEVNDL